MKRNHDLSYCNYSSPLAAAMLLRWLFTSPTANGPYQEPIRQALSQVTTGQDRLGSPISDTDGIFFAHKTGSGYRNSRGELTAHNDVGYFRLPDGRNYALAVFIKDFSGTETDASALIATISECVYKHFTSDGRDQN